MDGMILSSRRKLLKDGSWVLVGQVGAALGVLVGIRVLTEYVPPQIYGMVILYLGAIALSLGSLVTPVSQAVIRFYPEYAKGEIHSFRSSIYAVLAKRVLFFFLFLACSYPLLTYYFDVSGTVILLCILLLLLDGLRSLETSILNAAQKQKTYALMSLAEAWGRPFLAVLAVQYLGVSVEVILIAYALTSSLILLTFYLATDPEVSPQEGDARRTAAFLPKEIARYSLPLVPMAALGWMNGLGDRYLIGGMLGLEEAGVYAAVYGLMSRPFLMASGAVELTLRPHYNQLVAQKKHHEASRLLLKWLLLVGAVVGAGFGLIALLDSYLIQLLLAEKYHGGLQLMLWIAGGYVLLAVSDVFVKVCYAYGYTGRILAIQIVGAVLSLTSAVAGIHFYGLVGAAMAVPFYYFFILVITVIAAKPNLAKDDGEGAVNLPLLSKKVS